MESLKPLLLNGYIQVAGYEFIDLAIPGVERDQQLPTCGLLTAMYYYCPLIIACPAENAYRPFQGRYAFVRLA
jgi:hypothetical protein